MSLRSLLTGYAPIVRKEWIQIRRDPRMGALILAAPILFLLLFGYALRLQLENVPMAVWNEDEGLLPMLLTDELRNEGYFHLYEVGSEEEIRDDLLTGKAKAGLHIPADLSARLFDGEQADVRLYVDGTMPTLAIAAEGEADILAGDDLSSDLHFDPPDGPETVLAPTPIDLDVEVLYNPDLRDQDFFLPGIIGILIMQVALVLSSTALVREREYKTFEQLIVTPVTGPALILGKITPYAAVALFDFFLVVAVAHGWFGVPVVGSGLLMFGVAAVFIGTLLALGMLLSSFAETQQQAIFYAVFVMIPSVLLSGFVFPVEAMPELLQWLPRIIPLTYFLEAIRAVMLKGATFGVVAADLGGLAGFAVLFAGGAIARFRKTL